jgi:medium-chain acyl-[acyl-carrier-protein] hydrolase
MKPYRQDPSATTPPDRWIGVPTGVATGAAPQVRLFCLPYAGGSASIFRDWARALPARIELRPVHLPGRERRAMEPAIDDMDVLVPQLCDAMTPYLDHAFALFGHSMGAAIAHAVALELARRGAPPPVRLLVSGRQAPHLPPRSRPVHALPDAEFRDELRRLNGTPPAVLEHAELMEFMLPMLRADFRLIETYAPDPAARLQCDVAGFCAEHDPEGLPEDVAAWRDVTTGAFRLHRFPGDHFFIQSERAAVLAAIARELGAG